MDCQEYDKIHAFVASYYYIPKITGSTGTVWVTYEKQLAAVTEGIKHAMLCCYGQHDAKRKRLLSVINLRLSNFDVITLGTIDVLRRKRNRKIG